MMGMPQHELTWPGAVGETLTTADSLTRTPELQVWADMVSREVRVATGYAMVSALVVFGFVVIWPRLRGQTQEESMVGIGAESQLGADTELVSDPEPILELEESEFAGLEGSIAQKPAPAPLEKERVVMPRPSQVAREEAVSTKRMEPNEPKDTVHVKPRNGVEGILSRNREPGKIAMSYTNFWNIRELPFENVPDPRYYFPSPMHEEALHRLLYGIESQKGALMLTGEVGCGKTLLSRSLFSHLSSQKYDIALIANPSFEVNQFLSEVLYQFGLEASGPKVDLIHRLDSRLLENHKRGLKTVLVIDEAQVIRDDLLFEELRLLLNFQLNDRFLLTLVLMGQPELSARVLGIKQFAQRVSIRYHLGTLNAEETAQYIAIRLRAAGSDRDLFTKDAIHLIFKQSGGIPRNINTICDLALLIGYMERASVVDCPTIDRAAAEVT